MNQLKEKITRDALLLVLTHGNTPSLIDEIEKLALEYFIAGQELGKFKYEPN